MSQQATDKRVAVMMANGLEEIEGLTVVDLLYRAGIPCDTVSIERDTLVTSSHGVRVICDRALGDVDFSFEDYDLLVCMDDWNLQNMQRMFGSDYAEKTVKLLDLTPLKRDVADPWYTGDFEQTYRDLVLGCEALLCGSPAPKQFLNNR